VSVCKAVSIIIRYMEKRVKVLKISIKQLVSFLTKSTEWE